MQRIRNLRDVGCGINAILGTGLLKQFVLYRSGAINHVSNRDELPDVKTIINMRRTEDPEFEDIRQLQVTPRDTMNNYAITAEVFQEWIQRLYNTLADCVTWPLLMHCNAGKDRTGVGIALLLKNIGVPDDAIVQEYMQSDKTTYPESVERILDEMPKIDYLKMKATYVRKLKRSLLQE